jgi:hypothetical protein
VGKLFVLGQMRDVIASEVSTRAARLLSLLELPQDVTLSIPSITIDAASVSFQPALGCVGTGLSTFQPSAGQLIPE